MLGQGHKIFEIGSSLLTLILLHAMNWDAYCLSTKPSPIIEEVDIKDPFDH